MAKMVSLPSPGIIPERDADKTPILVAMHPVSTSVDLAVDDFNLIIAALK